MLTFLTKLRFNSGSLLRSLGDRRPSVDDEEEEEAAAASVGVGVSNETATERKKATRLTTFQSLRYSAVDTFRSSPHLDTRQGDREREREKDRACFSSTLEGK